MDHQPTASVAAGRFRLAQGVALFCAVGAAVYALAGVPPSTAAATFFRLAPSTAVILWLERDTHRTGVGAVFDSGFLLWFTSVMFVPWYTWKTRGLRGWRLALFVFILMGAQDVGEAIAAILIVSLS